MRALGVDVGVDKGLDVVVLEDGEPIPVATHRRVLLAALGGLIERARPTVVAIDAPPGWAIRGRSRQTEREIRYFGIQSFGTPTARRAARNRTRYYEWMRHGFRAFRIAERRGYPRYRGGSPRQTALEVFPHATAVVLSGCLPPTGVPKRSWRTSVLTAHGIEARRLATTDQVDAALAALTGLLALRGTHTALGDPNEGVIVLPARTLPAQPYRRCSGVAATPEHPRLPRMNPCACGHPGCAALTSREFAPGHDAKRKSMLWSLARAGHDATGELRRRGWELPPEMR